MLAEDKRHGLQTYVNRQTNSPLKSFTLGELIWNKNNKKKCKHKSIEGVILYTPSW